MSKTIKLDPYQEKLIQCHTNAIVIAGAGSGKSITIVEKIKDLINKEECTPKEILAISFTNSSVNDLKSKIPFDVDVFTFHKLAINILKSANINYSIASPNLLKYIVDEKLRTCDKNAQKIILKYLNISSTYNLFLQNKAYKCFCNFITTFINIYKCNNLTLEDISNIKFTTLEKKIITIIFDIYKTYLDEKQSANLLDLDDIIIYAASVVKNVRLKYKYIIIDEFQDTSRIRLNLIYNIFYTTSSKIIVVGDDYQSIYRFSGCDLNIFINYTKMFPNVETINLVNTYRNSLELIKIAAAFIQKNPIQIPKNVFSSKRNPTPVIFAPYTNKVKCLKRILTNLMEKTSDIMILARNNKDINEYIDKEFLINGNTIIFKNKSIKYYTVHKSKGLEAEYVVIINCNDNNLGFPNKIESNKIIAKLLPNNEMKHAEERRLFYVAITRCKEQTILLYDKGNPSIFIKEIKKITKKIVHKITIFK